MTAKTSSERSAHPRIALVHGVQAAMRPAQEAVRSELDCTIWNLLDDRLIDDALAGDGVTTALQERMQHLIDSAVDRADAVLITCSLYSFMAGLQPSDGVPVFGSDDAAFDEAVGAGRGITLVSSMPAALRDSEERLLGHAESRGATLDVASTLVAEVMPAVLAADYRRVAEVIAGTVPRQSVIVLAQYSLAPAAPLLAEITDSHVISPAAAAARTLRRLIEA
ncbi:hypothetical protein GCM10010988_21550 [Cnuibacter physcomitrellae]|uniref:Uncharacterized protein n=1 Tax=Cnuibacter physcomitrellae TaxID=1619308 RepID=A0A1X9LUA6_9MICO|nr:hypothetical protein [Cnuibacter physcomitrellae]ARJ06829.1 hypothetical protein B5808_17580 [Cnuibacter physcomitrellae]GGI38934.1 hypothetical protein GCM10010988_21550 [Cnuibacter physcomitrellae]